MSIRAMRASLIKVDLSTFRTLKKSGRGEKGWGEIDSRGRAFRQTFVSREETHRGEELFYRRMKGLNDGESRSGGRGLEKRCGGCTRRRMQLVVCRGGGGNRRGRDCITLLKLGVCGVKVYFAGFRAERYGYVMPTAGEFCFGSSQGTFTGESPIRVPGHGNGKGRREGRRLAGWDGSCRKYDFLGGTGTVGKQ